MGSKVSSGRSPAGACPDDDPYERRLAVDPVLRSIAEQISTRAALAVFRRVPDAAGGRVDPFRVGELGPDRLRVLGLSHAKAEVVVALARMHQNGTLDLDDLDRLDDDQVIQALTSARGVGLWTALLRVSLQSGPDR